VKTGENPEFCGLKLVFVKMLAMRRCGHTVFFILSCFLQKYNESCLAISKSLSQKVNTHKDNK